MKKCDHFKDLILTDYIDGQLDNDRRGASLEGHLLDCGQCRAFLKEVKNKGILPDQQALQQPVPVELWDTIKQRMEQENHGAINGVPAYLNFTEKLKGLLVFPRLAPVFASLILMLLAGSMTLNTIQIQQSKDKDQGEYLVSLLSPAEGTALSDNNEGPTPIEHYFL